MKVNRLEVEKTEGEGNPIIFIHGWLGSKDFWKLITPHLDIENPMVFYNQRCHGRSECNEFNTIEELAVDLYMIVEKLGLEDPIIVGHSMGGMTTLQYSSEFENYSGLCLLGTSASTPEPENRSVKFFLENFDEMKREKWADQITENYAGQVKDQEILEMTHKELMKADEKPIKYGLRAMINFDVRGELEKVDAPALLIAGEKDGAITMDKSRELANLLDCKMKTVETSHQMLPEEPEKVASYISDFIKTELN